jgi:hypothetical protein
MGENIISTCMNIMDKIEDNIKTRKDMVNLCNRPTRELTKSGGKPRHSVLNLNKRKKY